MRTVDPLFVACTRPEMKWGVVWDAFRVNVAATSIVTVVIAHSPPGMLIFPVIHFILREICRYDPHFFRKLRLWFFSRSLTPLYWITGLSFFRPVPARIRRAEEVRASV